MSEHLVILGCERDLEALQEIFALTLYRHQYTRIIHSILNRIIEHCYKRDEVIDCAHFEWTGWFVSLVPLSFPEPPYRPITVSMRGEADATDYRRDQRLLKDVVLSLARDIREQLAAHKLYDRHGRLTVKFRPNWDEQSGTVFLKKL